MNEVERPLPFAWCAALGRVQRVYPEAVIAGGALRDLRTGREAKDIDVFINGWRDTPLGGVQRAPREVAHWMASAFGVAPKMVINPEFCEYSQAIDGVTFAMEIPWVGNIPIQIIALDEQVTMQTACERIDFGICRVATDGKIIFRHPDFIHDLENECFTLRAVRTLPQLKRSVERHKRLQVKFPGWPMIARAEMPNNV